MRRLLLLAMLTGGCADGNHQQVTVAKLVAIPPPSNLSQTPPCPAMWNDVSRIGIEMDQARSVAAGLPADLGDLPALRFPMPLRVNGEVALECEATVVPPLPPLHFCGGIVSLAGHHPRDPERRFRLQLVGAGGPRAEVGALVR